MRLVMGNTSDDALKKVVALEAPRSGAYFGRLRRRYQIDNDDRDENSTEEYATRRVIFQCVSHRLSSTGMVTLCLSAVELFRTTP